MAKRSAKKYYDYIARATNKYVKRCDDMDIIAATGAIAIKATDSACAQYLQRMGLMDFRGTVREEATTEGMEALFERPTSPCIVTPYMLKVGDHIVQLIASPESKTIIAVKYNYMKLINQDDAVSMTNEDKSKLLVELADEDDIWDGTEIVIAPMIIGDLPEVERIKQHLPEWRFV